jgi:hypothetical protein
MKIEEIEGWENLATKLDIKGLELSIRELRAQLELSIRELRVEMKEQFQRIRLLIWLPVIAVLIQTIAGIILKSFHLI